MINAPISPTKVATQRRPSAASPSTTIASADPTIGRRKAIAVTSANEIMVAA